jgi:hypothetical protein
MDSFIITVAFTSNVAVNYVDIAGYNTHSPANEKSLFGKLNFIIS